MFLLTITVTLQSGTDSTLLSRVCTRVLFDRGSMENGVDDACTENARVRTSFKPYNKFQAARLHSVSSYAGFDNLATCNLLQLEALDLLRICISNLLYFHLTIIAKSANIIIPQMFQMVQPAGRGPKLKWGCLYPPHRSLKKNLLLALGE